MGRLIDEQDAIKLLEENVNAHESNFGMKGRFLDHSYNARQIAKKTAEKLGLDSEELALAGYFHDIGRCFAEDSRGHVFHEIIGANYIRAKGLELEISDSPAQIDRLASSIISHGFVYEQFEMEEYSRWLSSDLKDTDSGLLLLSSWNELIVIYADLAGLNGKTVKFEERFSELEERDRKSNNPRLKAVERAKPRLLALEKDLLCALEKGEVDTTKYCLL
jgi:putative nucleotidyltransferase with HDIG domain